MNERIQELSKQAGDYVNETYTPPVRSKTPGKIWEDGHVGWHTQFNEKFAELMVGEFIGVLEREIELCEQYKATSCNDFDRRWQEGKIQHFHKLIDKTKKHFGVESCTN